MVRPTTAITTYDEDGAITGFAQLDAEYIDENLNYIPGAHNGDLFYVDPVDKSVKPNNENPAVISHAGQIVQGTIVQITGLVEKSKVDVTNVGRISVDDGFLDITTDQTLGQITIRAQAPRYKPVTWTLEVVTP